MVGVLVVASETGFAVEVVALMVVGDNSGCDYI